MNRRSLFWGTILILLGGLLLLDNMNLLPVNVWQLFWPLLLIAIGLYSLLGTAFRQSSLEAQSAAIPLQEASRAHLHIRYGAGRLELGAGAEPGQLASGTFGGGVEHRSRLDGDRLDVEMRVPEGRWPDAFMPWMWGRSVRDWSVRLNNAVPLQLDLETGASESRLDLTDLRVTEFRLKTGASSTDLTLPANAGHTRASIEAGAASVNVRVPPGVAARVQARGGMASINIDTSRFPRQGDAYQSSDYDSASNKLEFDIQAGAGSVDVR